MSTIEKALGNRQQELPAVPPEPGSMVPSNAAMSLDERAEVVRKSIERSEYNPLHPPGYKNPYNRNTWVIWLLAAIGVLVVGGVILVNLLR